MVATLGLWAAGSKGEGAQAGHLLEQTNLFTLVDFQYYCFLDKEIFEKHHLASVAKSILSGKGMCRKELT